MSLSTEALLAKMKEELTLAQTMNDSEQTAHIYALKVLCELALQNKEAGIISTSSEKMPIPQTTTASSINQSQPLRTEDGANGDSLFDF